MWLWRMCAVVPHQDTPVAVLNLVGISMDNEWATGQMELLVEPYRHVMSGPRISREWQVCIQRWQADAKSGDVPIAQMHAGGVRCVLTYI